MVFYPSKYMFLPAGDAHPGGLAIGARPQVPVRARARILHGHDGAAHDGVRVHDAVRVADHDAAHDAIRVADHGAVRVADHDAGRVADHDGVRGCACDNNARHLLR